MVSTANRGSNRRITRTSEIPEARSWILPAEPELRRRPGANQGMIRDSGTQVGVRVQQLTETYSPSRWPDPNVEPRFWVVRTVRGLSRKTVKISMRRVASAGVALALIIGLPSCSCKGPGTPEAAKTADEAVERVAHGIADGELQHVWYAIPDSYQEDVTEIVHEFAGKMDAELWNRTFSVLDKLTRLVKDKRDFILDHPMIAGQIESRRDAEKSWKSVVETLDVLVSSELSDLDDLESLDIEKFLTGTGNDFMKQLTAAAAVTGENGYADGMKTLGELKATVVESDGDTAMVKVELPGKPAKTDPYVRVEGKWIPKSMADEWQGNMAATRSKLAAFSGQMENKASVLMQLSMVEGALDTLLAADTSDEFNAGIGAMMGMAMAAMMSQASETGSAGSFGMPPSLSGSSTPSLQMFGSGAGSGPVAGSGDDAASDISMPRRTGPLEEIMGASVLSEADRYIGRNLRVISRQGMNTQARLVAIEGDTLHFERPFGAGSLSFEMHRNEIETLRMPVR